MSNHRKIWNCKENGFLYREHLFITPANEEDPQCIRCGAYRYPIVVADKQEIKAALGLTGE